MRLRTLVPVLLASACLGQDGLVYRGSDYRDNWLDPSLPYLDIRLGVGYLPAPDAYEVTVKELPAFGGNTYHVVDTVDEDQATAFSFGVIGGKLDPVGLLAGGELVYTTASQRLESRTVDGAPFALPAETSLYQYRTLGPNLLLGGGWRMASWLHIEALGVLGAGWLDSEFGEVLGTESSDGGGWYWNAGLRGGLYLTYERFHIGLVAEYTRIELSANDSLVDAELSLDQQVSGLGFWLQLGVHLQ